MKELSEEDWNNLEECEVVTVSMELRRRFKLFKDGNVRNREGKVNMIRYKEYKKKYEGDVV